MEFFKKLGNKVKNTFTKKSDDNVIIEKNGAKIENSDNKKKNEKISIETMKSEFDTLALQINNFLTLFNESQNNANVKLLEIIENLYAIHNNLIKKIKKFKIETRLQTQKIEDIKEEYEDKISCCDTKAIKAIKYEIESGTLGIILSNFEELKGTIAKLNVQQLKSINIEFKSLFDKNKNKEIENMRKKILDSLGNLCNIICNDNELIQFFENIFLKKQAIEKKEKEEQKKKLEEEKRKRLEEEERRKKEEEEKKFKELEKKEKTKTQKELSELMDKFLEKYPSDFDYKDATDDFYSIFKGIMKLCGGYTENILSNDFFEWNVEFDDNAKLSEKSAEKKDKFFI